MTTQQLLVPSNATLKRNVMDYSLIVVGSFLQALSYVLFLAPYKIVPGGVYGISIVIHYVTKDLFPFFPDGLPMGATALCFSILSAQCQSLPEIHQTSSAHKRSILQKTSSIHNSKPILIITYPQIYGINLNSLKYPVWANPC